jgi:cytoskeletal protein RodZ
MADKIPRRVASTHLGGTVQVHVRDEGQEENRELIRRVRVRKQSLLTPGQWWILALVVLFVVLVWVMERLYPTTP